MRSVIFVGVLWTVERGKACMLSIVIIEIRPGARHLSLMAATATVKRADIGFYQLQLFLNVAYTIKLNLKHCRNIRVHHVVEHT